MKTGEKKSIISLSKIDKSDCKSFKFGEIAFNISERVEPKNTDAEIYVGLEHLDPDSIHIRRTGVPSDVEGTKLKVYKGDIIFGKRRAYQRKAAIAHFDGICSAHSMVLRANPETIEPDLFPFFIHSDIFMNRAVDISEGSLSPTIKWRTLSEQEFCLPSRPIQKKLAELLWAIDDVSEKNHKIAEAINIYKSVFLKRLLSNGSGKELRLGDMGELVRGVGYKPDDVGMEYSNTHLPILRSNNIQNGKIKFSNLYFISKNRINEYQILKEGDIVICMSNGSKELVGKTAEFNGYNCPISFGLFCAVFRPAKEYYEITKYLFQTTTYREHIRLLLTGTNINNLKPSDIESISFNVTKEALNMKTLKHLSVVDQSQKQNTIYNQNIKNIAMALVSNFFPYEF